MWADTETEIDFLNYSEVAELISEMIATPDLLPLSLGVFGGWGVGKSSTLRLVERELSKPGSNYLIIKFDAWLYQGFDGARTALMSVIVDELLKAAPPGLKEKAKGLFLRINKLRTLGLVVEGGALAMGIPTFGLLARGLRDWVTPSAAMPMPRMSMPLRKVRPTPCGRLKACSRTRKIA